MTTIQMVLTALGVIGGGSGIVALFKMRPEMSRIMVSTATEMITNLNNEIKRLREEVAEERRICEERLEEQGQEIARLRAEVADLRTAFDAIDERKKRHREEEP
jgi:ubiquinone biosynthesis protein UbiJ